MHKRKHCLNEAPAINTLQTIFPNYCLIETSFTFARSGGWVGLGLLSGWPVGVGFGGDGGGGGGGGLINIYSIDALFDLNGLYYISFMPWLNKIISNFPYLRNIPPYSTLRCFPLEELCSKWSFQNRVWMLPIPTALSRNWALPHRLQSVFVDCDDYCIFPNISRAIPVRRTACH